MRTAMIAGAQHAFYGLSDGGAHCGTISDASFPTTTLALWSKGSKSGLKFGIEALVHGYPSATPATSAGATAASSPPATSLTSDLIDIGALELSPPAVVHDLPAGGARLVQKARGYRSTIKSGEVTFENGE